MERRTFESELEWRSTSGPGSIGIVEGFAPVFDKVSRDLGGFVEVVDSKATRRTLAQKGNRILGRYNHSSLLGTTSSGTLKLSAEDRGVHYGLDVPDTAAGRDVAVLMERGDVTGSSFAFIKHGAEWDKTERGYPLRVLTEIALIDVGPVDDPAYFDSPASMAGARAMEALEDLVTESRSLDVLLQAAAEHRLGELLDGEVVDEVEVDEEDGGDGAPDETARPDATDLARRLQMDADLAEALSST